MRRLVLLLFLAAAVQTLSGCLAHVRRPVAVSGGAAGTVPDDELAGERPTSTQTLADTAQAGAEVARARPESEPLPRDRRESVKQVNEYALWCIQHSMWNEARSHLERALSQDSLAASLHNNLAIVYEHFGMDDEAEALYRRAAEMAAHSEDYRHNLDELELRRSAANDTTGTIDLFEVKQRIPGPRSEPY